MTSSWEWSWNIYICFDFLVKEMLDSGSHTTEINIVLQPRGLETRCVSLFSLVKLFFIEGLSRRSTYRWWYVKKWDKLFVHVWLYVRTEISSLPLYNFCLVHVLVISRFFFSTSALCMKISKLIFDNRLLNTTPGYGIAKTTSTIVI